MTSVEPSNAAAVISRGESSSFSAWPFRSIKSTFLSETTKIPPSATKTSINGDVPRSISTPGDDPPPAAPLPEVPPAAPLPEVPPAAWLPPTPGPGPGPSEDVLAAVLYPLAELTPCGSLGHRQGPNVESRRHTCAPSSPPTQAQATCWPGTQRAYVP